MSDIVTSQIFVDGEKGITATKMNNIVAGSVIQPAFYSAKPSSSTLDPTDQLLELKGTGAYATITGSQLISSVGTNLMPIITAVRLRSFTSVANRTFELDQRNVGNLITIPAGAANVWAQDRWIHSKNAATMILSGQQIGNQNVMLPGTSFRISQAYQVITLTAAQATLAAGEYGYLQQTIEGPRFRELASDVHSVSILAYTNVAGGLKFGLSLRDPATAHSLVKLCTISASAQWELITLPNIPVFIGSGNFSQLPGTAGYILAICYACGSAPTAPANDVWQNGNFIGAIGQDNLGSKPTGSYLSIAFIQHEPGAICTTPIDFPYRQNYEIDCLPYYQKSYDYGTKAGSVTTNGQVIVRMAAADTFAWVPVRFIKPMAKVPVLTVYSPATGAINNARNQSTAADAAVSSIYSTGDSGYGGVNLTSSAAAGQAMGWHHIADTNW